MPVLKGKKHVVDAPYAPMFPSQRFLIAVLLFFGSMVMYVDRGNISVAILCMVRDSVNDDNNNNTASDIIVGNGSDVTTASPVEEGQCGAVDDGKSSVADIHGEFDWDKSTKSQLLAMYFYGYAITQVPGGWLASRFGGKIVWGVAMVITSACTLLTPFSARMSVDLACAIRFIIGFAAGVSCPCMHALLGRWCPPYERSKLTAFAYSGPAMGNILTFSISGVLCEYGFDNGWGSIFYISGVANVAWVVAWFMLAADSPDSKANKVSTRERVYIHTAIGKGEVKNARKIPWLPMCTSGPVWGAVIAHSCTNWINYSLLTTLPSFMKESLKFDIKQNGVLSALPYITQFFGSIAAGQLADTLRERGILNTTNTRKVFQCTSLFGVAVLMSCVGQMTCEHRYIAVLLLCICTIFVSMSRGGYMINHLDLAPSYSGVVYGMTNTIATIPGMIAPIVAGALTPNKTSEEWRNVFYVSSGVCVFGGVLFLILGDGELQTWAMDKENHVIQIVGDSGLDPDSHGLTSSEHKAVLDEANATKDDQDLEAACENENADGNVENGNMKTVNA